MSHEPDLTTFAVLHRLMREDSGRFAKAIAEVGELDRTVRVPSLTRWYAGFCAELHDHHTIEDEIFYPALAARRPDAAPLIAQIDVDHDRLAHLLERMTVVLERLGNPHVPFRVAHGEAMMIADGLHDLLQVHLDFEDDDVVPDFIRFFTGEEYDALEKQAQKLIKVRQLAFTIPWVMEGATEEERARLLRDTPLFFKALWYATRGRYRRLATAVFAPAPASVVRV